jgi:hypothetical protein
MDVGGLRARERHGRVVLPTAAVVAGAVGSLVMEGSD